MYCYGNEIESLNVSQNTKLELLSCFSNALTSLDLSANTELLYLWCGNNELTSLDLSHNTNIDYLECDNNTYNVDKVNCKVGNYDYGALPTAHARTIEGKQFSHWESNGTIVSYNSDYTFKLTKETNLKAVYVSEENAEIKQLLTIVMSNVYAVTASGKNKVSFESTRSVPDGYTVTAYGAIYSTKYYSENDLTLDNGTLTKGVYKTAVTDNIKTNGIYTLTINCTNNENKTVYVRGHVTYENAEGETLTLYTDIVGKSFDDVNNTAANN